MPEVLEGNPKCPDQFFELKVDPPVNGTYTGEFGLLHVTVTFTDKKESPNSSTGNPTSASIR